MQDALLGHTKEWREAVKRNPNNTLDQSPQPGNGRDFTITHDYRSLPQQLSFAYQLPARFLEKIVYDPSGCWIWQGATGFHPKYRKHRYGQIKVTTGFKQSYLTTAHRYAYEVANGVSVPKGMDVDHICGTKLCVNPAHLQVLSHWDNCKKRGAR